MHRLISITAAALLLAIVAGCDRSESAVNGTKVEKLPATLVLSTAPGSAVDVKALKSTAKAVDEVIIHGVVGGRVDPLSSNRAIMTIVDPKLQTCDKITGDTCATPWDACCEDQETITAHAATIRVVNESGQPLKAGLQGVGGIKPLSEVTVVGKVQSMDEKNLVVDATGIYVKS